MALTVNTARSFEELRAAFSLVYDQYRAMKLIEDNPAKMHFSVRDFFPTSTVTIVKDNNAVLGTATAYRANAQHLPFAKLFPEELKNDFITENCSCAEGTKFATLFSRSKIRDKQVPTLLIKCMFSWCVANTIDYFFMVTHPDHAIFWQHAANFQIISDIKSCPHVNNAPGVLLKLDVKQTIDTNNSSVSKSARKLLLEKWIDGRKILPSYQVSQCEVELLIASHPKAWFSASKHDRAQLRLLFPKLKQEAEQVLSDNQLYLPSLASNP